MFLGKALSSQRCENGAFVNSMVQRTISRTVTNAGLSFLKLPLLFPEGMSKHQWPVCLSLNLNYM